MTILYLGVCIVSLMLLIVNGRTVNISFQNLGCAQSFCTSMLWNYSNNELKVLSRNLTVQIAEGPQLPFCSWCHCNENKLVKLTIISILFLRQKFLYCLAFFS
uniref:Uncharacterized protein n=1 Tax=Spongospora subterranea TaxID=70186 RepID=A0A0H5R598_9EUKA|eukprot:CRZ03314.1 hypothetical protein [Spongospora subterranea]